MTCGIYSIKNMVNGKEYIGRDSRIDRRNRIKNHLLKLKRRNHDNDYLQNSWNKYGEIAFQYSVVENCVSERLAEREMFYIKDRNTKYPNGYNLTDGGEGLLNPSYEVRQKMSIAHKQAIEKYGNPLLGRKHTPEELEKMRSYRHTDEELEKMRASSSGSNNSMFGKKQSLESNRKNSDSQKREKSWRFGKKNKNSTSKYFGIRRSTRGEQVY